MTDTRTDGSGTADEYVLYDRTTEVRLGTVSLNPYAVELTEAGAAREALAEELAALDDRMTMDTGPAEVAGGQADSTGDGDSGAEAESGSEVEGEGEGEGEDEEEVGGDTDPVGEGRVPLTEKPAALRSQLDMVCRQHEVAYAPSDEAPDLAAAPGTWHKYRLMDARYFAGLAAYAFDIDAESVVAPAADPQDADVSRVRQVATPDGGDDGVEWVPPDIRFGLTDEDPGT